MMLILLKQILLKNYLRKMEGVNFESGLATIKKYNSSCISNNQFDPTILDGRKTINLKIPKSNWAQTIDKPPYRAYPVTGGITFTYGGVKSFRK